MEKTGEEPAELEGFPSISVDADEPCNLADLKKLDSISYYYENIFTLEDMQLYKGVFLFYAGRYQEAIKDFQSALLTLKGLHGSMLKTN
jgi:tetratricopeptide (TPR) repeat protein